MERRALHDQSWQILRQIVALVALHQLPPAERRMDRAAQSGAAIQGNRGLMGAHAMVDGPSGDGGCTGLHGLEMRQCRNDGGLCSTESMRSLWNRAVAPGLDGGDRSLHSGMPLTRSS